MSGHEFRDHLAGTAGGTSPDFGDTFEISDEYRYQEAHSTTLTHELITSGLSEELAALVHLISVPEDFEPKGRTIPTATIHTNGLITNAEDGKQNTIEAARVTGSKIAIYIENEQTGPLNFLEAGIQTQIPGLTREWAPATTALAYVRKNLVERGFHVHDMPHSHGNFVTEMSYEVMKQSLGFTFHPQETRMSCECIGVELTSWPEEIDVVTFLTENDPAGLATGFGSSLREMIIGHHPDTIGVPKPVFKIPGSFHGYQEYLAHYHKFQVLAAHVNPAHLARTILGADRTKKWGDSTRQQFKQHAFEVGGDTLIVALAELTGTKVDPQMFRASEE